MKKKLGAVAKTTDCHPVSQWIKSISNHVYWCAASTEPGPDRGEVVLAKWQSVANHVQNVHEHAQPTFPRCQHGDLPEDLTRYNWLKSGNNKSSIVNTCFAHVPTLHEYRHKFGTDI